MQKLHRLNRKTNQMNEQKKATEKWNIKKEKELETIAEKKRRTMCIEGTELN